MVVAFSAKLMVTSPEPPLPEPVPFWPVWMAIALRAGTMPVKEPLETVNLDGGQ